MIDGIGEGESIHTALGKLWQKPDSCISESREGCSEAVPYAADPPGVCTPYKCRYVGLTVAQVIAATLRKFPDVTAFRPKQIRSDRLEAGQKWESAHIFYGASKP